MVSVFGWPDPNTWECCSSEEKRANHSPSARVSRAFLNSRNIPACLDQAIETRKP
jgi:hypothetical protein